MLYARLRPAASTEETNVRKKTMSLLNDWGGDGLRTLVFACK